MQKIGVFGGTFDPVHYGHIYLVKQAIDECALSQVVVIPANEQPFKLDQAVTKGVHRYNMAKLAFEHDDKISVSDIELKKGDISYTVDTLRELKKRYGEDAQISFIAGTDTFLKIEQWKGADELLNDYSFIIGTRPGYRESELDDVISRLKGYYNTEVVKINNVQIPVSSTEIKEMIKSGKGCGEALPPEVERYITANELYS